MFFKKFLIGQLFLLSALFAKWERPDLHGNYVPWYTGSIFSTAGLNVPVGLFNLQPFIYYSGYYGTYSDQYRVKHSPYLHEIESQTLWKTGLAPFVDVEVITQFFYRTRKNQSSFQVGDLPCTIGFQAHITSFLDPIPSIRITLQEIFPTGKYNNLNPKKLSTEETGSGSFQTSLAINTQKIYYWNFNHPVRIRTNTNFTVPSKVSLKGFNAYGGGFGAKGKLFRGYNINFLFSPEISFTQRWVITWDLIYQHTFRGSFHGNPGVLADGSKSKIQTVSQDFLQFAPALEYNFNANTGVLGGVWVNLFARNTSAFFSGIVSLTTVF